MSPSAALQLDLTLQCLGQVYHQQLHKSGDQRNPSYRVQIPLRPHPHDVNAAIGPDILAGRCHRAVLAAVATHGVEQSRRVICGVYATRIWHAAALGAGRTAVEVLVFAPIQVTCTAQAAALELLLSKVDEILQVCVISV